MNGQEHVVRLGSELNATMIAAVSEYATRYGPLTPEEVKKIFGGLLPAADDPGAYLVYFTGEHPLTICVKLEDARQCRIETLDEFAMQTGYRIVHVTTSPVTHHSPK